jgi:hypothetical protein
LARGTEEMMIIANIFSTQRVIKTVKSSSSSSLALLCMRLKGRLLEKEALERVAI